MSFLQLENLSKHYGDFTAVEKLNLTVEKGEFVSLLGPSGCGKTTTLQMIAGFVDASAGRVILDGRDITHEKPNRRGLGIVFQSYALFPHMTVSANVSFGLEMRQIAPAERAERVRKALALVHLDKFGHRYPRELSGGQRQRVALARALVIEPPVLLLDEPMSNLDAKLREDMQVELREIQRKVGTTTIMVTHDQSEALSMSDRVVVMDAGCAIQIAKPFDAYENPVNQFVSQFVGKANLFEGLVASVNRQGSALNVHGQLLTTCDPTLQIGERVTLCLRPEKLERCSPQDEIIRGRVRSGMFLGNQWLYHIDTGLGDLLATWQNCGNAACSNGEEVSLRWPADALHIVKREHQEAQHG
ncbi:ABC transporter ATP-binding protein [Collimonas antrihumi]|uniref:ABC transporter ATP-binding protein n=1 Tax=Collimonas antrihumi TaxID=1940615 RepID=UPI001B8C86E6|nr:ABC transporter ATP-binding protein [Collimonas antrihumi]